MIKLWDGQAAWRLRFDTEESAGEDGSLLTQRQCTGDGTMVLATGLGKAASVTPDILSRAAAKAVRTAASFGAEAAVLAMDKAGFGRAEVTALVKGAALARLAPQRFAAQPEVAARKGKPPLPVYLDGAGVENPEALLAECNLLAELTGFARDLTNRPASLCTPAMMASEMARAAKATGVEAEVLDEHAVHSLGMRALLAVGASAEAPPRLVVLRYNGAPQSNQRLALVGKGVTCDTGGYCLKPSGSMEGIRGDMAGGAAVCAALLALARQGARVNAVAVVPAAENRISRGSYVPGDVIGSMAGKSIYIGNTDAEGRLLLADAVTYALQKEGATHVVDVATLTGAAHAFFGHVTTPMVSNNDGFAAALEEAAGEAGEKVWRVPAFAEYRELLDCPLADISNMSTGGCGTLTAAQFIQEFAGDTPWAHLDIAGTAWVDSPKKEYHAKGATGAMVETLYRLGLRFGE